MTREGYLKFNCIRSNEDIFIPLTSFDALSVWRRKMFEKGLIGVYPDGVGYGNISVRATGSGFYISGTATGNLVELSQIHYALVNTWQTEQNSLSCTGRINASAESLSHAAIYDSAPLIGAVIHIHNKEMWEKYINRIPTTPAAVYYGTPEMAYEIRKIVKDLKSSQDSILVMGGHEDGIIAWGKTLAYAGETILKYFHGSQ